MMMKWITMIILMVSMTGSMLAQKEWDITLDGTEYQMREYYVVFLHKVAGKEGLPEEIKDSIMKGHMAHLSNAAKEGYIVLNGPFNDEGDLRGMSVYNTETIEEAETIAKRDPAVSAGLFTVEIHPWYAAKGSCLVGSREEVESAAEE